MGITRPSQQLIRTLMDSTAGNPLFVQEADGPADGLVITVWFTPPNIGACVDIFNNHV